MTNANPRIAINGTKLSFAISDAQLSYEDVTRITRRQGSGVNVRTVRRLINDEKGELASLKAVCDAIEQSHEGFLEDQVFQSSDEANFLGNWIGYFVEAEWGSDPHVVVEEIELVRNGRAILGRSVYRDEKGPRVEHFSNIRASREMIRGEARVEGWNYPDGLGFFQLKSIQGGRLLDGMTISADGYSTKIEASRYIWVKESSEEYYKNMARAEMSKEISLFQERRRMR